MSSHIQMLDEKATAGKSAERKRKNGVRPCAGSRPDNLVRRNRRGADRYLVENRMGKVDRALAGS